MATKKTPAKATTSSRKKTSVKTVAKPRHQAETPPAPKPRDPRLPKVGSTITRRYKGSDIEVKVLDDGFEYQGQHFRSLSGLARHIVGYQISGPVFFRLDKASGDRPQKES